MILSRAIDSSKLQPFELPPHRQQLAIIDDLLERYARAAVRVEARTKNQTEISAQTSCI